LSERRSFRRFQKREPALTTEQKIEKFILRNSDSGYFTKVSTIPYKFEIPESKAWDIVGELLGDGTLESIHDEFTGEMKLCRMEKRYSILDMERKRKRDKYKTNKKTSKPKQPRKHLNQNKNKENS